MGIDDNTKVALSNENIARLGRVQKFKMFFAGLIFAIISFIGANPIKNAFQQIKILEVFGLGLLFISGAIVLLEISEGELKRSQLDLWIYRLLSRFTKYHWGAFLLGMLILIINRAFMLFFN